MSNQKSRIAIPDNARIRPQYSSQLVKQNQNVVNFFPALATRNIWLDNYIQNPLPGNDTRLVAGLSFDLNKVFIKNDPDNGINAAAIINGLKHAGVRITADQNETQFLRAPIDEHSNFSMTEYEGAQATAYVNGAYVSKQVQSSIIKSSDMYELRDPFELAANQNLNVEVTFDNAANFPTQAQWEASGQSDLYMVATLYLAELNG